MSANKGVSSIRTPQALGRSALLMLLIVLAVAVVLRLKFLVAPEVWLDEANTIAMAREPLPHLFELLTWDSSPPLYYLVLHYWMAMFGESPASVRLLATVGGILLVFCGFVVGRQMFSTRVGLVTSALLAVSPIQVFYSQQTRQYSWLSVAALLSFYCLWRTLNEPRWRHVVGYSVATLAAVYLHNQAFFLLFAQGLVWLLWRGWKAVPWPMTSVWVAAVALGYLPWIPTLLRQVERMEYLWWVNWTWKENSTGTMLGSTLLAFSYERGDALYRLPMSTGDRVVVALVGAALAVAIGIAIRRAFAMRTAEQGGATGPKRDSAALALAIYGLVPLVVSYVTSITGGQYNYIPGRSDQMVFAVWTLLLAAVFSGRMPATPGGLKRSLVRIVGVSVVLGFVGLSVAGLYSRYTQDLKHGSEQAAAKIAKYARPGDAIVFFMGLERASIEYYLRRDGVEIEIHSFPAHMADHLGNWVPSKLFADPEASAREARTFLEPLGRRVKQGARVFFVFPVPFRGPGQVLGMAWDAACGLTRPGAQWRFEPRGLYLFVVVVCGNLQ